MVRILRDVSYHLWLKIKNIQNRINHATENNLNAIYCSYMKYFLYLCRRFFV
jgi:hypothetical protein